VGSHGSSSLLFVMKVMVCHFVSDSHEVMIALIVVLPLIVVVEISLQLHQAILYKFHGTHLFIIPNLLCTSFREFSVLWMISNRLLTHLRLMIKDTAYVLLPLDHSGIDKIWAQKQ
jgi:hypothetical protein